MKRLVSGTFCLLLTLAYPTWAANDLGRSPLLIDTVMTAAIFPNGVRITSLRWVNVTTPGHKLVIMDSGGRKLFETTCPTAATEYEAPTAFTAPRGLQVTTLQSGIVYITYE